MSVVALLFFPFEIYFFALDVFVVFVLFFFFVCAIHRNHNHDHVKRTTQQMVDLMYVSETN